MKQTKEKNMKIQIYYKGKPNKKLEKELKEKLSNWKEIGSGYNFQTDERDLEFEKNTHKPL